jgi:hypothetical protein
MEELITHSDNLNKKAKKLVESFPFRELAEKHFGNITYTGSFVFNCMMDADIDSNIILKPLDKSRVISFANDLVDIKECRKVILYNRIYEKIPYFIINIERFTFMDESWVLTFFIQEEDFQGAIARNNDLLSLITPENREILLELKDWRIKNNLKADISSVMLYDAVLHNGIVDVEQFKNYIKNIYPEKFHNL